MGLGLANGPSPALSESEDNEMFPWVGEDAVVTADKQWEESELSGLCKDMCLEQLKPIKEDMAHGKNVVWYDKTLLNTDDLYVHVFGNLCLCDMYDQNGGLELFEKWALALIAKTISDNKYKHYVEG